MVIIGMDATAIAISGNIFGGGGGGGGILSICGPVN